MRLFPSLTHVLVMVFAIQVEDASETRTSCPSAACIGQAVNITCDITGVYESIGFSRPDNIEVVTCLRNTGKCYQNVPNYEIVLLSDEKHILRINKFSPVDSGTWNCRDGTNPLKKTCQVTTYDDLGDVASRLKVQCGPLRKETFRVVDVCTGLSNDSRVNVTLTLFDRGRTHVGEVALPVHDAARNVSTTCYVTGPGTNCLDPSQRQRTAVCSRPVDLGDVASRLKVECGPLRKETFRVVDVCTGLSNDSRVNVTLTLFDGERTYDGLTGEVALPVHDATRNVSTTCCVTGPGTNSLDPSQRQRTAVCSRPGKPKANPHMSSTGREDEPTLRGAVVIVTGVLLAVRGL